MLIEMAPAVHGFDDGGQKSSSTDAAKMCRVSISSDLPADSEAEVRTRAVECCTVNPGTEPHGSPAAKVFRELALFCGEHEVKSQDASTVKQGN